MEAPSTWISSPRRRNLAIVAGCLLLVVYIAFLVASNYRNQNALRESTLKAFRLDLEKRATSLGYFFNERNFDLRSLAASRDVATYFTNRSLGMSEQYGLKVSLFVIDQLFRRTLTDKTIHGDPIYGRILLLNQDGVTLVDTQQANTSQEVNEEWTSLVYSRQTEPQLLFSDHSGKKQILVTVPCFLKNQTVGRLVAWLDLTTLFHHLIDFPPAFSGRGIRLVVDEGRVISPPGQDAGLAATLSLAQIASFPQDDFSAWTGIAANGKPEEMLGTRLPVHGTPLSLVAWVAKSEIFGPLTPWQLLVGTGSLAMVILIGIAFMTRFITQNLILRARFDESELQQGLLSSKNQQLEEEIGRRCQVEAALRQKQSLVEEQKQELQKSMEKAYALAYFDTLTGLPNRELCSDRLRQALTTAHRDQTLLAVLFLDLDRFKEINDTLGHTNGDLLLKAVAKRLKGCIRESDTVARLGGDEFILLLQGIRHQNEAITVAQKVLEKMDHCFDLEGHEVFTSASIGVVLYPDDGTDPQTLLKHADMAMYAAKSSGRNNYQFFSNRMNLEALERRELEVALRQAISRDELFLVYQPQWDVAARKIIGVEALLRWQHSEQGLIMPDRFISLAEETGLILPIGEWVFREACLQAKTWREMGLAPLRIAVNLSGRQFMQNTLLDNIDNLLKETGMGHGGLEIEFTENIFLDNARANILFLNGLKSRGIQLTIDDFGTGYSSLNYLKNFPIDRIKIDRSFLQDINHQSSNAALVEAIIAMARSLRLHVVAEGVETRDQLMYLQERNCHIMQGNYLSPPLPAKDVTPLLVKYLHGQELFETALPVLPANDPDKPGLLH